MTGWRKPSRCVNSNCVWVDVRHDTVLMANHPLVAGTGASPVLTFTHDEWAAFLAGVRNGEFDL